MSYRDAESERERGGEKGRWGIGRWKGKEIDSSERLIRTHIADVSLCITVTERERERERERGGAREKERGFGRDGRLGEDRTEK